MYQPDRDAVADREGRLQSYAEFLRDLPRFAKALERVLMEWPIACEQFLSNESINRIAWLGQASMCLETGVPRKYRAGFMRLSVQEQRRANATAQQALTRWIKRHAGKNSVISDDLAPPRLF
jgi:hypothetical protein